METEMVTLRMPIEIKRSLEQLADNNFRSLSKQILFMLDECVKQEISD